MWEAAWVLLLRLWPWAALCLVLADAVMPFSFCSPQPYPCSLYQALLYRTESACAQAIWNTRHVSSNKQGKKRCFSHIRNRKRWRWCQWMAWTAVSDMRYWGQHMCETCLQKQRQNPDCSGSYWSWDLREATALLFPLFLGELEEAVGTKDTWSVICP